tara:strand:- start:640 stop:1509 length:870 start_codon:yes stop_codon:yes gene_type:complete
MKEVITPNFFVVGSQKAGTTTFYDIFSKHPEVYIPKKKELRFFTYHYSKGIDWYLEKYFQLPENNNYKAIGEVNPGYISSPLVPSRIREHLGANTKIIILMRQPVKRAYSAYNMFKKTENEVFKDWTKYNFETQIKKELNGEVNSNYIKQGLYFENYSRFKQEFGAKNIKLIIFEEFIGNNRKVILDDICGFLGISPLISSTASVHANKASLPRKKWLKFVYNSNPVMRYIRNYLNSFPRTKSYLKSLFTVSPPKLSNELINKITEDYFEEDIILLEKELGFKIDKWNR